MKTYFDNVHKIERNGFLVRFGKHVFDREKLDEFELEIFCNFASAKYLQCYLGNLNERGLDNLVLPHHAIDMDGKSSPDRPVKVDGDKFRKVIRDYQEDYIPNTRFPICTKKI